MGDMDDIIEAFNEKTLETIKPLKDKIDNLESSNQELVNSNQELVNSNQELVSSNQELVRQIEELRIKKNIPFILFKEIKENNPGISDEDAFAKAKEQLDSSVDFS